MGVPKGEFWKDHRVGLSMDGVPIGERVLNAISGILTVREGIDGEARAVGVCGRNSEAVALGLNCGAIAFKGLGEPKGEEGADEPERLGAL